MAQSLPGIFINGIISGSYSGSSQRYPVTGGFVYNIFDTASVLWYDNATPTNKNTNFITGSSTLLRFPTYSISQTGNYQIKADFALSSVFASSTSSGSYEFSITQNGINLYDTIIDHTGSINVWKYIDINAQTSPLSFTTGDKVDFRLKLTGFNTNNFTASISQGEVYSVPVITNNILYTVTTSSSPFISGSIDGNGDGNADTIIFNPGISSIIGLAKYVPEYMSGSIYLSSSLYSKYGSIDIDFTPQKGDLFLFKILSATSGILQYNYRILRAYSLNGKYYIYLSDALPQALNISTYTTSSFEEVLFLRESPDETLVLLDFKKKEGRTSYGFIIPENLNKDVLDNIDTITKEIKVKLPEINNNQ